MRLRLRRLLTAILVLAAVMVSIVNFLYSFDGPYDLAAAGAAGSGETGRWYPHEDNARHVFHPGRHKLPQPVPHVHGRFNPTHQYEEISQNVVQSSQESPRGLISYLRYLFAGNKKKVVKKRVFKPYVWPAGLEEKDERILTQLTYVPEHYKRMNATQRKLKTILVFNGITDARPGQDRFLEDKCPVNACSIVADHKFGTKADAVLFQGSISKPSWQKPSHQIWIVFYLESPHHTSIMTEMYGLVNWTATYRRDSTIMTPYELYVPNPNATQVPLKLPTRNYAKNKTKLIAWFVSNCRTKNNRFEYAQELTKYLPVDIFGACGFKSCPRTNSNECYQMLNMEYKFYLAFENSNCKDYITEKFFWNGLLNDVIPIVMGARPEDYALSAPPHSYIHVDDFDSPKELAEYLHKLDKDDDLYNEYFAWKGRGHFINTKFYCRLCAMLHDESRQSWYSDIQNWWAGSEICVEASTSNPYASWRVHRNRERTATGGGGGGGGAKVPAAANQTNVAPMKRKFLHYAFVNKSRGIV